MEPEHFINMAVAEAKSGINSNAGGPFGAVIVRNNEVISYAHNEVTSTNDPTAHAEVLAIRRACNKLGKFQLDDCEIYTSCEPCPMCLGAIYWARLKKVYYSSTKDDAAKIDFDDSFIYNQINTINSERKIQFIKIDSKEADSLFNFWVDKSDKIKY